MDKIKHRLASTFRISRRRELQQSLQANDRKPDQADDMTPDQAVDSISTQAEPIICENCRKVDFDWLLANPLPSDEIPQDSRYFHLMRSDNCKLCNVLMPGCPPGEVRVLRSFLSSSFGRWTSENVLATSQSLFLCPTRLEDMFLDNGDSIVYFPPCHSVQSPRLWQPRVVSDTPNYEAARQWLANCQTCHGLTCEHLSRHLIKGMRLIDLDTQRIVAADRLQDPHWIALSYVWGSPQHCSPIEVIGGNRLPDKLPRTIEDAITVAKRLEFRYIWIDELCVDQNDAAHCASQIKQMDQIYRGADLTIVAAAGDHKNHGLPGVGLKQRAHSTIMVPSGGIIQNIGPDPLLSTRDSAWSKRAWTFQESYLSHRLLIFTDHQMSFFCPKTCWKEALCGPEAIDMQNINWDDWPVKPQIWDFEPSGALQYAWNLLHDYTCRVLSYDDDAMNAVSGVLHHLNRANAPVYNLGGLPCFIDIQEPSNHSFEDAVAQALSWYQYDTAPQPERRKAFRTWTWAGWSAAAGWIDTLAGVILTSYIENVVLEDSADKRFGLLELSHCESGTELQSKLDSVKTLIFTAPIILCVPVDGFYIEVGNKRCSYLRFPEWARLKLAHKVEQGTWSCVCLKKKNYLYILVVAWVDEHTAERLTGFDVGTFGWPDEEYDRYIGSLERRRIRLI
ncbi:heterokaryon incompatibility protein-domain-containing protein [Paraphoma chrysanthemicola]|nr:heterokaryon incompatibility protein-domain-containing protein [Paraphoma chrysanthemicola]